MANSGIWLKISNDSEAPTSIEKLTAVFFPDYPTLGKCTVYLEGLLNNSIQRFLIHCFSTTELTDVSSQFTEKRPCEKIIRGFRIRRDGHYAQTLDRENFDFVVSPPKIEKHSDDEPQSFHIQIGGEEYRGFWLRFETSSNPFSAGRTEQKIEIECEGIQIKRVYPFLALPDSFRLSNNPAENFFAIISKDSSSQYLNGSLNAVFVGKDWPLFMSWRSSFRNKYAISPKEKIELKPNEIISIFITAISEKIIARYQVMSFAFAFLGALFLGVTINYGGDFLYQYLDNNCFSHMVTNQDTKANLLTPHKSYPDNVVFAQSAKTGAAGNDASRNLLPNESCPSNNMLKFAFFAFLCASGAAVMSFLFSKRATANVG